MFGCFGLWLGFFIIFFLFFNRATRVTKTHAVASLRLSLTDVRPGLIISLGTEVPAAVVTKLLQLCQVTPPEATNRSSYIYVCVGIKQTRHDTLIGEL